MSDETFRFLDLLVFLFIRSINCQNNKIGTLRNPKRIVEENCETGAQNPGTTPTLLHNAGASRRMTHELYSKRIETNALYFSSQIKKKYSVFDFL